MVGRDALSKKWLSGINKNFKVKIKKDLFFLQKICIFFRLCLKIFLGHISISIFFRKRQVYRFFTIKIGNNCLEKIVLNIFINGIIYFQYLTFTF